MPTLTDQQMDINMIMEVLPHRFPILLVDRILEMSENHCRGLKNVTINEQFFQGHYPGRPIMPGVLILEAMAQTGAVLLLNRPEYKGMTPLLGAFDKVKYKRQVVPGDQLLMDVELLWIRNGVGKTIATATVDGELVAKMEMTFKLMPND